MTWQLCYCAVLYSSVWYLLQQTAMPCHIAEHLPAQHWHDVSEVDSSPQGTWTQVAHSRKATAVQRNAHSHLLLPMSAVTSSLPPCNLSSLMHRHSIRTDSPCTLPMPCMRRMTHTGDTQLTQASMMLPWSLVMPIGMTTQAFLSQACSQQAWLQGKTTPIQLPHLGTEPATTILKAALPATPSSLETPVTSCFCLLSQSQRARLGLFTPQSKSLVLLTCTINWHSPQHSLLLCSRLRHSCYNCLQQAG